MVYKKGSCLTTFIVIVFAVLYGCRQTQQTAKEPLQKHSFAVNGSVREMNIWPETVELPDHEGKGVFMSYCSMCHSLKYITMQPEFPRKVWEAEITKMVVKYNAPMDSAISKKIADYIMEAQPAFHIQKTGY